MNPNEFGSAHSLHTEAINFSKFMIAILEKQGLSKVNYDEMLKIQVEVPVEHIFRKATGSSYWSLGFAVDSTKNGVVYSHFGDNWDFSSYFNLYPDKKTGIVLFTNSGKIQYTDFITRLGVFLDEEIICDPSQFD